MHHQNIMHIDHTRISKIQKASLSSSKYLRDSDFSQFSVFGSPQKCYNQNKSLHRNLFYDNQISGLTKYNSKYPFQTNPYFSQKQQEQIFCVICKKSYGNNQLEAHLFMHQKSKQSPSKIKEYQPKLPNQLISSRNTKFLSLRPKQTLAKQKINTNKLITNSQILKDFGSPLSFGTSISKVKTHDKITPLAPRQKLLNIAPLIPKTERINPPKKTNIFNPFSQLGLLNQVSEEATYQEQYLNINPQHFTLYYNDEVTSQNDLSSVRSYRTGGSQKYSLKNKKIVDSSRKNQNESRFTEAESDFRRQNTLGSQSKEYRRKQMYRLEGIRQNKLIGC